MRRWLITLFLLLLTGGAFWYYRYRSTTRPADLFHQRSAQVTHGALVVTVSATGVVEPLNLVEIKSKASGLVEELPIEEGQPVARGALIARLDQTQAKNDYEQAKADLQVAEATLAQRENMLRRQEQLFQEHLISPEVLDQAKLELVQARSQLIRARTNLANAEERLRDTTVRSPFTGIILRKNVEVGQIISSGVSNVGGGTLIATVADLSRVYVKADVDEVDIGQIHPGQKARIVPDAFPDEVFEGEVVRLAPQARVEQNVTTFQVTILVHNPQGRLKAGMNTTVEITVARREQALLVPTEALQEVRSGGPFASGGASPGPGERRGWPRGSEEDPQRGETFPTQALNGRQRMVLVREGEGFVPRLVRVGINNFYYAEVLVGLEEGDEVLLATVSRALTEQQQFLERMRRARGLGVTRDQAGGGRRP